MGDITQDMSNNGVSNRFGTTNLVNLGNDEEGGWRLAADTGPDQYYVRSDAPEPVTLALFGLGLGGLGLSRRKRV